MTANETGPFAGVCNNSKYGEHTWTYGGRDGDKYIALCKWCGVIKATDAQ